MHSNKLYGVGIQFEPTSIALVAWLTVSIYHNDITIQINGSYILIMSISPDINNSNF